MGRVRDRVDDIRFCLDYDTGGVAELCDGTCTAWVAHGHPERPLARGAWVCDCKACVGSIRAAATCGLDLGLVLKSSMDRQIITLDEAVEAMDAHGDEFGMDIAYLRDPDDFMREIFVVQWPSWMPKRRLLVLAGGVDLEVYVGQRISDGG